MIIETHGVRIGLVVIGVAVGLFGLAALAAGSDYPAFGILFAAVGLNLLIVGPWFIARPHAGRLRRFLPPWLHW